MEYEPPHEDESTVAQTGPLFGGAATNPEDIRHYLVVVDGTDVGRRIQLSQTPLKIGRDAGQDLVLHDPQISRSHVHVVIRDNHVIVEDQKSTNGTSIDGNRVTGSAVLPEGGLLQVGHHVLRFERRSWRDVEREDELKRDLDTATHYVRSLLPQPLTSGDIRTDWFFEPSALLGGDAFGYQHIDDDAFAMYLIDVSGHGVGAAMHSVSVINVLRQRALPDVDLREPAAVLSGLNAMFQMDRHDGMYFTMWYGVFHRARRLLRYACAGHHAGYLRPPNRTALTPLKTRGLMIGATPETIYHVGEAPVSASSSLYLFSDGVFEIVTADQSQWRLRHFEPLLMEAPIPSTPESQRLYKAVRTAAKPGPLADDFSLLVVTFA